mgnify:FL=1
MKTIINRHISIDSAFCHGRPVFKGTRIPVSTILELIESGMSIEEILQGLPSLTKKGIQAALHFAAQVIEKEEFIPVA